MVTMMIGIYLSNAVLSNDRIEIFPDDFDELQLDVRTTQRT